MGIVSIILFCITVLSLLYLFYNKPLNKEIMNITWYRYDIRTGTYEQLEINEKNIIYKHNSSNDNSFNNCSRYRYNSKSRTIILDCGEKMHIKGYNSDYLIVSFENEEKKFYTMYEQSLDYEFSNFFDKTILEYKDEKSQVKDLIKIESGKLESLYKANNYSIVVFDGDNCSNLDCTLLLGVLEKWMVDNSNVFYVNSTESIKNSITKLNKLNKNIVKDEKYYNDSYPIIMIIGKSELKEYRNFKCSGFDCTMWKNYALNYK